MNESSDDECKPNESESSIALSMMSTVRRVLLWCAGKRSIDVIGCRHECHECHGRLLRRLVLSRPLFPEVAVKVVVQEAWEKESVSCIYECSCENDFCLAIAVELPLLMST
jgi:hypothetical protein